jgi:hypothetical protein
MVQQLAEQLPAGYVAEPRVHLGGFYEIDVSTFEEERPPPPANPNPDSNGGVAAATHAPPAPTLTVEADLPEEYEYEVLIYDVERERRLVAAVEIVSPANKDRPESRQLFVAKCARLLQKGICLSIIDLVTIRHANLYTELLTLINCSDPSFAPDPPAIYAVTCRTRAVDRRTRVEIWSHVLTLGQPLPELPIWLSDRQAVALDLEGSYEATCRVLRIP